MKRIFVPSQGLSSWQALLADPELHWKRGASAMELAVSWELAATDPRGLPPAVARVFDMHDATRDATLMFAVPEHRVALPGGRRASQTDLWAVVRGTSGLASVAVEGKAGEPFGPTVGEWLVDATAGKRTRLNAVCDQLGLADADPLIRYQLLHRAASAVLEAKRIGAAMAVLVVQNFRAESLSWADFDRFGLALGAKVCRNGICEVNQRNGSDRLLLAWVDCPPATDEMLHRVEPAQVATET